MLRENTPTIQESCLDLIFTSDENVITHRVIPGLPSDHDILSANIACTVETSVCKKKLCLCDWRNYSPDKVREFALLHPIAMSPHDSIDMVADKISDALLSITDIVAPFRVIRTNTVRDV